MTSMILGIAMIVLAVLSTCALFRFRRSCRDEIRRRAQAGLCRLAELEKIRGRALCRNQFCGVYGVPCPECFAKETRNNDR